MKYKILVHSKNAALIADFIKNSETFFNTVSTSDYLPDVLNHFEFFNPDAFVCFFMDYEPERTLSNLSLLKKEAVYNGAPIFVVADAETCKVIEEKFGFTVDVLIRRPITQDNLTLRITRHFEAIKAANEKMKTAQAKQAEIIAKEEAEAKKAAESANEKKHILIVDDDRTVLKMLKAALSDKYDVTTMANGIVVDKFLETKKVDLIVLDYEMPVETGADIFRKIKKNPKTANIPVCFLTGVSEREKILEVMSLKPHGYLLKPIDIDMLKATISDLTQ